MFVLKEEMERLQQNIESLKAEAAEDGEEQVIANVYIFIFNLCFKMLV